jgi:hypothetical protein
LITARVTLSDEFRLGLAPTFGLACHEEIVAAGVDGLALSDADRSRQSLAHTTRQAFAVLLPS